ncbi:hypothetical protein JTE90_028645 [Oedothorax gibbosus]|uniref:C2H2-type domain-containing protein n=1 Tax=Oedothorax gibbosus TaxID=931172 RepID=A0AAV6UXI1_9ARAC|nr:hypothetical protein JTE90_028645 [Oedothorax gibbosus]
MPHNASKTHHCDTPVSEFKKKLVKNVTKYCHPGESKENYSNALTSMKPCAVVLDTFHGLDNNTRGNLLFFQCQQCNGYFRNEYSYNHHMLTHPKAESDKSLKFVRISVNGSFSKSAIHKFQWSLNEDDDIPYIKRNITYKSLLKSPTFGSFSRTRRSPKRQSLNINSKTESKLVDFQCSTCCYQTKSSFKFKKHLCNKPLNNIKPCTVVLNKMSGLDTNIEGITLFFKCPLCNLYFVEGYSYSQHMSTHPEAHSYSIETKSLNVNNPYQASIIGMNEVITDANELISSDVTLKDVPDESASNVMFVEPNKSVSPVISVDQNEQRGILKPDICESSDSTSHDSLYSASNEQQKKRSFCCVS